MMIIHLATGTNGIGGVGTMVWEVTHGKFDLCSFTLKKYSERVIY